MAPTSKNRWVLDFSVVFTAIGLLGGGFSWWYFNLFVPATSPVHLDISLSIDRDPAAKDDGVVWPEFYNQAAPSVRLVPLDVNVKSESLGQSVTLYDPIYVVWGMRVIDNETDREKFDSGFDSFFDIKTDKRSITLRQSLDHRFVADFIAYGRILNSTTLNAGQTLRGGRIIPVPAATYDFLQIRIIIPSGLGTGGTTITSKTATPSLLISESSQAQDRKVTQSVVGDILVSYRIDKENGTLTNTLFCYVDAKRGQKELEGLDLPCDGNIVSAEDKDRRGLKVYTYTKEIWLDNV